MTLRAESGAVCGCLGGMGGMRIRIQAGVEPERRGKKTKKTFLGTSSTNITCLHRHITNNVKVDCEFVWRLFEACVVEQE